MRCALQLSRGADDWILPGDAPESHDIEAFGLQRVRAPLITSHRQCPLSRGIRMRNDYKAWYDVDAPSITCSVPESTSPISTARQKSSRSPSMQDR